MCSQACTQTDPETPPPLRPRTRGFVPASERVSVSNIRTSSRFTDNLLLGPEEVPSAKVRERMCGTVLMLNLNSPTS
ncbi:hypothetical protein MTO96_033973 [Rhipicephalus appendiculatus]